MFIIIYCKLQFEHKLSRKLCRFSQHEKYLLHKLCALNVIYESCFNEPSFFASLKALKFSISREQLF
jgi:hypothetical protein